MLRHGGAARSPHAEIERREGEIGTRNFTLDDFQGLSVDEGAELIRNEPVEHAVIYTPAGRALYYRRSWPGEPYKVTVPIGKTGLLRGNVFVHNHPGNESFSADDLWMLLRHGVRELRAYGPRRAFRAVVTSRTPRIGFAIAVEERRALDVRHRRAILAPEPLFRRLVEARILDDDEAWSARTHGAVRQLALHYRFVYQEI